MSALVFPQPGLRGSPEQPGLSGSPAREIAFRVLMGHAPTLSAFAFKLLAHLLDVAIARDVLVVRAGRRRAMRHCGFCRKGYDRARRDIAAVVTVIPGLNGSPLLFDLRGIWAAGLQGSPVPGYVNAQPGLHGSPAQAGLSGSPVYSQPAQAGLSGSPAQPGLHGSPVSLQPAQPGLHGSPQPPGLQGSPVPSQPGLHGSPVGPPDSPDSPYATGPLREPGFVKPGLHGSPVGISTTGPLREPGLKQPGLHGSPVGISTTGPLREPGFVKPGLHGSPVSGETATDLRSRSLIDRSIDPRSENGTQKTGPPREPTTAEVATARGWLQMLRYQDGHAVHASAEACVYALKTAGSMERLNWAVGKISTRLSSNPQWRPKGAKTLRPWLRRTIATELEKLDNDGADTRAEATGPPPEPAFPEGRMPAESERVDTSGLVSGLGRVKSLR